MGSFLACYREPKLIKSLNEPSKELRIRGRTSTKPNISEDFWTTSACDMDNSAMQSQGSISSISTSNQILVPHGAAGANVPSEFVNHGLLLWNQTRQNWIRNKRSDNQAQQIQEPKIKTYCLSMVKHFWLCSWNATYDSLLGSNKPFRQPVPLSEMVDFLVDDWDREGLYD
ncbi:uncharacterized protein LOC100250951 isoform X3 [Vitis vinifera]|uniref:uncharacterized protein LOC100250951 isoform X3 n=1 Tax=Vitis vinifera TaxID=29760 RepID=UPI0005400B7A|nr:uncharacterized protein LOC100250951 isoform X3 [Vitis vinifera]|eukprot:XP_010654785.1 PREDICTED: uncharacterized protein LOC100250951 isoform X3 [Vitis vinifera]